jgi:TetR/AcrR family transcriptional regulator, transcriptional repressor for nem operon
VLALHLLHQLAHFVQRFAVPDFTDLRKQLALFFLDVVLRVFLQHLDLGLPLLVRGAELADLADEHVEHVVLLVAFEDQVLGALVLLQTRVEEGFLHGLVELEHFAQLLPEPLGLGAFGLFELAKDGLDFVVFVLEESEDVHDAQGRGKGRARRRREQPLDNIPTGLYRFDMSRAVAVRAPEETRRKILMAAFAEFYQHSFQGGSLNRIVEAAGATKGAVFHHFESKQALGYAVVDDIIGPLLLQRWLEPVRTSQDPIAELQKTFRRYVSEDVESGNYIFGCPLNNLAQEMSPLDDGFLQRINHLYEQWRDAYAEALERGIQAGTVKASVSPTAAAALIVSAQMGVWGSGKSSRDAKVMRQAAQGVIDYLESLRA